MNSLSKSFMKRKLSYGETPNIWLEKNSSPVGWKTEEDFPAYWMTPENMNAFLNFGEYGTENLYKNPNYSPYPLNYETSALNPDNFGSLHAMSKPKSSLTMIHPYWDDYDYLNLHLEQNKAKYPESVYQHELGHFYDPRINKTNPDLLSDELSRRKFERLMNSGAERRIASVEAPAIMRENTWKRKNFITSY